MRSTTLRVARAKRASTKSLPEKVGRDSKKVDTAPPGKHSRLLYDHLVRKEAGVLAQLRTGWLGSIHTSIAYERRHRTSVRAEKRERQWTTSCFDVGNGTNTEQRCFNVQITLSIGATSPSS